MSPEQTAAIATISAALGDAARAGMNPAEAFHAAQHHDGQPGPGHVSEASRTVAAFLRALDPTALQNVINRRPPPWTMALAAEVEAVAALREVGA